MKLDDDPSNAKWVSIDSFVLREVVDVFSFWQLYARIQIFLYGHMSKHSANNSKKQKSPPLWLIDEYGDVDEMMRNDADWLQIWL